MKKLILLALICCSTGVYASDGSVTVNRGQGTYTVGSPRGR